MNLNAPQRTILVNLVKSHCVVAVVEKYRDLGKFNMKVITKPEGEGEGEEAGKGGKVITKAEGEAGKGGKVAAAAAEEEVAGQQGGGEMGEGEGGAAADAGEGKGS